MEKRFARFTEMGKSIDTVRKAFDLSHNLENRDEGREV